LTDGPAPAVVHLPRSLVSLFPAAERRMPASGATVLDVIRDLDLRVPGVANRVPHSGPTIRTHVSVFVNGQRASLESRVPPGADVHVIPAVSGG
jgi:hypothetical protein